MHEVVASRREEIAELCRRHRVACLDVFGSAATGDFDPQTSDIDFVVDFGDLEPKAKADGYFGLLAGLEDLLDCKIDLVMISAVKNPYFLESLEKSRQHLYAA